MSAGPLSSASTGFEAAAERAAIHRRGLPAGNQQRVCGLCNSVQATGRPASSRPVSRPFSSRRYSSLLPKVTTSTPLSTTSSPFGAVQVLALGHGLHLPFSITYTRVGSGGIEARGAGFEAARPRRTRGPSLATAMSFKKVDPGLGMSPFGAPVLRSNLRTHCDIRSTYSTPREDAACLWVRPASPCRHRRR